MRHYLRETVSLKSDSRFRTRMTETGAIKLSIFPNSLKKILGLLPFDYWDGAQNQKIYVVDTNLFFECKSLEELPWSELVGEDIVLVVTQYVLDEIEKHKKRRESGRTKKRALKIATKMRPLILGEDASLVINKESPRVCLRLETLLRPSSRTENKLDQSIIDNKIVGCVDTLRTAGLDASILSHDGNAISTANSLSLPSKLIPDHWLLPLQDDDDTRENKKLKQELERLKKQEPEVKVSCLDDDGNILQHCEFVRKRFSPLEGVKIDELIEKLKENVAIETDFGSIDTTPKPRPLGFLAHRFITVTTFEPASEEEIADYQMRFSDWPGRCREYLENLHENLSRREKRSMMILDIENIGTRPAKSALFEFQTSENFGIMPPPISKKDDKGEGKKTYAPIALPPLPAPPKGQWKAEQRNFMTATEQLMGFAERNSFLDQDKISALSRNLALTPNISSRDPDAFYWKEGRSSVAQDYCALTCENWRHAMEPETFRFELYPDGNDDTIKGALTCQIHAENLSRPKKLTIPVTFNIVQSEISELAERLVNDLISTQGK